MDMAVDVGQGGGDKDATHGMNGCGLRLEVSIAKPRAAIWPLAAMAQRGLGRHCSPLAGIAGERTGSAGSWGCTIPASRGKYPPRGVRFIRKKDGRLKTNVGSEKIAECTERTDS
jgi:hypothetical protein